MKSTSTSTTPSVEIPTLTDDEQIEIAAINARFFEILHGEADRVIRDEVLRQYVSLRQTFLDRGARFGLVNNRIYLRPGQMLIPYLLGRVLLIYQVGEDSDDSFRSHRLRHGVIITDDFVARLTGFEGTPVDLEDELFGLHEERCKSVRVGHIRDMATQLERIAQSANRADATYLLRTLVAQTSLFSFKEYLTAKNLQTEVRRLHVQLLHFINSPLSYELPFLVRILVRNISGVVAKPKLIDRLWNDTIELAEVHLRGSRIVNEIRRSTHHAVGKRTLQTVQSYLEYLVTGKTEGLSQLGYPEPGRADKEARKKEHPKVIVARILEDLQELLGSTDILSRIRDWRTAYSTTLFRCESDESLADEVEEVVVDGIKDCNRWVFSHHIRIIRNRVSQFGLLNNARATEKRLNDLLAQKPDASSFDANATESELRDCVSEFTNAVLSEYQESLFKTLEELASAYLQEAFFETFVKICELRKRLRTGLDRGAFPEQRLLLYELDCLLEEISFVAMRHIASRYDEDEVDLPQCLEVISWCALNLTHDGLHSRQLLDLVGMLDDKSHTYAELINVLQQIQRNYQHILRQLTVPFEKMHSRLALEEEDLRIALANMQRFLHDLNSMAAFADTALTHIEYNISDTDTRFDEEARVQEEDKIDWIVHLSHYQEIQDLVLGARPSRNLRDLYGGKGSGLIYISYLNIPTPDGFIIPTSVARRRVQERDDSWLDDRIRKHLAIFEGDIGESQGSARKFGQPDEPLLLAVRGGSVFSMPGILSTVLFVGMNDQAAESLSGVDPWHAYDSYRRFLASYAQAVWGVDVEKYNLVEEAKTKHRVKYKDALPWEAMRDVVEGTKVVIRNEGYGEVLDEALNDPFRQLSAAVRAVMNSWNHPTSKWYRELKSICNTWQSAVVIQEMASGNRRNEDILIGMDETKASLTGVIPRSQVTELGVRQATGEFKFSACGEDLVGGLTTSISFSPVSEMKSFMPMLYRRLHHMVTRLRRFMGTDQEIEFTVERGVLSVLQSRAAEIGANKASYAFRDPGEAITRGLGIRGSAFRGLVAFDEQDFNELKAIDLTDRDDVDGVILVLENPTPSDIPLVLMAEGLLASKGGSTSHAAVAINSIEHKDYSAVMSTSRLRVNARRHEATIVDDDGNTIANIHTGDIISIQGSTGMVYTGTRPIDRDRQ